MLLLLLCEGEAGVRTGRAMDCIVTRRRRGWRHPARRRLRLRLRLRLALTLGAGKKIDVQRRDGGRGRGRCARQALQHAAAPAGRGRVAG